MPNNTITMEYIAECVRESIKADSLVLGAMVNAGSHLAKAVEAVYAGSLTGLSLRDIKAVTGLQASTVTAWALTGQAMRLEGEYDPAGEWSVTHAIRKLINSATAATNVPTVRKVVESAKDLPTLAGALAKLSKVAKVAKVAEPTTEPTEPEPTEPETVADDFTTAIAAAVKAVEAVMTVAPLDVSDADMAAFRTLTDVVILLGRQLSPAKVDA